MVCLITLTRSWRLRRSMGFRYEIMWYATQARDEYPYYQHTAIGYNYRMSNVCAATLDPEVRIAGQENAYKEVIKTAVGGAAGVIHAVDCATTDCQPNENVEVLRVFMLAKKIECRPVWKPMHKQPVYEGAPVYTNGVEEDLFKVGFCLPAGPYVTDEDVRYIVECIKEAIVR